ncbi:hypothetical protein KI387_020373, partial [Taxus chinensis]
MMALESKTSSLPDSIIAFTEEEVVENVTSHIRIIPSKVLNSLEGSLLMVQGRIDGATKPFTMNSISRLVALQSDIARFGPSLEDVEECIKVLNGGLLQFRTEKKVVAKTDEKMLNYMFDNSARKGALQFTHTFDFSLGFLGVDYNRNVILMIDCVFASPLHVVDDFAHVFLRSLEAAYKNASDNLLNEINDSCCDLILKTLLDEWKDCKKALEVPALHKDIRLIILPDSPSIIPDGNFSSFMIRERMLDASKVFVLFHQVMNLILRGTLPEIPPSDLIKEFPASSRAKSAGLDSLSLRVGVEVNLGDAVPCRIAFEEGKELHVYMLAVVKGASGWLLLAEEVLFKPQRGVVFAYAPLAGLKPKVDEIHPRWLHLQIRSDDLPSFGSKLVGITIGRNRTNQVPDGSWTLAFSDEQS